MFLCLRSLRHLAQYTPRKLVVDGIYGSKSAAAVRGMQRMWNANLMNRFALSLDVDSIYGPDTRYADKTVDWLAATRGEYYYIDNYMC